MSSTTTIKEAFPDACHLEREVNQLLFSRKLLLENLPSTETESLSEIPHREPTGTLLYFPRKLSIRLPRLSTYLNVTLRICSTKIEFRLPSGLHKIYFRVVADTVSLGGFYIRTLSNFDCPYFASGAFDKTSERQS